MQRLFRGLACAAACLASTAQAQTPAPSGRTIQLSKAVINPDIDKANQHVKVGTICLFTGGPLDFGSGERTLNYERFERLLSATLKKRGFNVIEKSSNLFENADGPKPDLLIGAIIHPVSVDICDSVNGQKGVISFSVEWQIYDRAKAQVVETSKSQGSGQVPKFDHNGLTLMYDSAFSAATDALVDQGVLQKLAAAPADPATPASGAPAAQ